MRSLLPFFFCSLALADVPDSKPSPPAAVSTLDESDLKDFDKNPEPIQKLIRAALALTKKNLTYTFGSSDPARGGMDCSGTIYHLLQARGIKNLPRSSDEMCRWIDDKSKLHRTEDVFTADHEKLAALQPGDLIFWSGTYTPVVGKARITHVMLYLGRRAKDNKPLIFGASDGRSYEGQRRCGVSVFDFKLPKKGDKAALHGFGPLPRQQDIHPTRPGK